MATWNADDLEGGDYGRVVRLGDLSDVSGQGNSDGFTATVDGKSVFVEWGNTIQVSTSVNEPGDDTKSPPLLHLDTAKDLAQNDQLETVN